MASQASKLIIRAASIRRHGQAMQIALQTGLITEDEFILSDSELRELILSVPLTEIYRVAYAMALTK